MSVILNTLRAQYAPLAQSEESPVVAAAQNGDVDAQHRLFASVSALAVRSCLKVLWNQSPEELLGDLYLVFLDCLRSFDAAKGYRFSTWFGTKAHFYCLDQGRARSREWAEDSCVDPATLAQAEDEGDMELPELDALCALFSPDSRERWVLNALAGRGREAALSQAEVARALGCARQNVNAMLGRIRQRYLACA